MYHLLPLILKNLFLVNLPFSSYSKVFVFLSPLPPKTQGLPSTLWKIHSYKNLETRHNLWIAQIFGKGCGIRCSQFLRHWLSPPKSPPPHLKSSKLYIPLPHFTSLSCKITGHQKPPPLGHDIICEYPRMKWLFYTWTVDFFFLTF